MDTSILIIGGGLSGLVSAWELTKRGIDFQLIEARNRFGGRILSVPSLDANSTQSSAIDLGPAWFWPDQKNMANLVKEMQLDSSVFLQPTAGMSVMEYQNGKIETGQGSAAMADSYRLDGGINSLIVQLLSRIPATDLVTNAVASVLSQTSAGVSTVILVNGFAHTIDSQHVVLALPPRLVAHSLTFVQPLPSAANNSLNSIATWMAGQAKLVVVYKQPFWRDQGMSGDGLSHLGPMVEIHDASPLTGGPYALFGFVGVPATQREGHCVEMKEAAIDQLVRMFGDAANEPLAVYFQDWAFEPFTSTETDRISQGGHSSGADLPKTEWDNRIVWSGTESADQHAHSNGYLEGAVESGLRAADVLTELLSGNNVA